MFAANQPITVLTVYKTAADDEQEASKNIEAAFLGEME